ncbi:nuclear transport factor 2 family protein [Nonomuraea typhae]|uniref:Nuclear transport factor 2 family protein n=1 Tax=Nonomuraea typhae TaxID=2603600 RepID=A0ABW7Z4T3_9ACTN
MTDTRAAAQRFADTWQHGWCHHDAEAILTLYADDAVHTSMPFRPPHRGKAEISDYIRRSFAEEHAPRAHFEPPIVDGDRAAIEYHVTDGDHTLAGCVFITFGDDGRAVQTRDYWHET